MTFYIPNLNPLRFTGGAGNKFDRLLMEELINRFQDKKCYFQKWNLGDTTKLQILSDFEFTFKIYDLDGVLFEEITPEAVSTNIIGQSFSVYEIEMIFAEAGGYYAVIEYDGNTLISEAWEVGNFPDTVLYKYKNSENNFSVVFDTGIEMAYRVEGLVTEFEPKADDVIYNDQSRNSRILESVPWRSFQLYVGNQEGVPEWVADKANRILACDVVYIDSETFDGYISKVEGAEWEISRAEQYAFIGLKTEIMLVENDLLERLKRGAENGSGSNNIKVIQKVENYFDVTGVVTISGVFAKYRLLEKICIEKQTGSPDFVLKVGTTNGGSEIAEFNISESASTLQINHLFLGTQTIYITGLTSELPFLSVVYKNLIEAPVAVGGGEGAESNVPMGAILIYSAMSGRNLTDDFDVITGLGREGTQWFGWAICNGSNGTADLKERFVLGFSNGQNTDGQIGGEKEVTLTIAQMPKHSHGYVNHVGDDTRRGVGTGARVFDFNRNNQTTEAGNDEAHNNMPPYVVKAFVQKIF